MAKKKKDEIEENDDLHQDNDNINEADDSFGLPDVDFEPISREEPEEEPEEEPSYTTTDSIEEEEETTVEEPYNNDYQEEEVEREVVEEEYTVKETVYYEPESDENAYESEKEQEYVPGSYTPPKDNSVVPKVLGVLVVVLLAAIAIWFFVFEQPKNDQAESDALRAKADSVEQAQLAEKQREAERIAQEEAARRAAEEQAAAEAAAKPKIGAIETISSRTGRYYVVVASAIDGDLAMDHAKKLSKAGSDVAIIKPFGKSKFHRVAIGSTDSWAEAQNNANDLKGEYGDGVWVIKY
ncbi:SPOR domain-containing protein [Fulvivirga ligni]|uniref:SPOR domain-containing protein n=1 Tax=Fulvivirga ligni TaxID=2904246 RepID=UPI001F2C6A11|nr:SPOR domain-containing protein [Fulvivirga ligni]UII19207.1 SPOR domain-containing protein [Fulvivirga ligni]